MRIEDEAILVRIEGEKTIVTVVSYFESADHEAAYNEAFRAYSSLFAALLPPYGLLDLAALGGSNFSAVDRTMYGSLAALGGIQPKEDQQ